MSSFFSKPYLLTATLIAFVLALGLIQFNKVISVNVYDMYFLARRIHLSIAFSILFLLFSVILFSFDLLAIPISRTAVWLYCLLTILAVLVMYIAPVFEIHSAANSPEELMRKSLIDIRINTFVFFAIATFIVTQLWFFTMLVIWSIRKIIDN